MKAIHPEDLWKVIEFYQGRYESSIKFRYIEKDGSLSKKCMSGTAFCEADGKVVSIVGSVDVYKRQWFRRCYLDNGGFELE